jgi:hypothetical protein
MALILQTVGGARPQSHPEEGFTMKKLMVILLTGWAFALSYHVQNAAADKKSPLRGHWSASQVSYVNFVGFGGATTTSVAAFTVDNSGGLIGHGTINSACTAAGPACPTPNPLEIDFSGALTANEDGTAVLTLVLPRITVDRTCVLMRKQGDCFQEFRCVNTSPNKEVVLLEVKRQLSGTCQ